MSRRYMRAALPGLALVVAVSAAQAQTTPLPVTLELDFESASAVSALLERDSVSDEDLDRVFELPGVQALVRQTRRFDDAATEAAFKTTLRAVVRGDTPSPDPFNFTGVRDRLEEIRPAIRWLEANHEKLAADLADRIGRYSPGEDILRVPVFLVVGGTSDGWARDGAFHVALHYFRGDMDGLELLMAHELFHVAQTTFMPNSGIREGPSTLENVEMLLSSTVSEGTASLLWWPEDGPRGGVYVEGVLQRKLERNQRRVTDIFALFDLMVLRAHSDPEFDFASVYNLGFSGAWDSPFYYLGYRVARTIERHRGLEVLRELLARPPVDLFLEYVSVYMERPEDSSLVRFTSETEAVIRELSAAGGSPR